MVLGVGITFVISAAVVFAADSGPITTKSIGTNGPSVAPGFGCPVTGCVGSLITCAADEGLSPINVTYYYIRNVCDNREAGGLPVCDGNYVGYGEECSRAVDGYTSVFVDSRVTDGKFRVCYSNNALGEADCASEEPAAKVIAKGTTQSHTNRVSDTQILLGVGETKLKKSPT